MSEKNADPPPPYSSNGPSAPYPEGEVPAYPSPPTDTMGHPYGQPAGQPYVYSVGQPYAGQTAYPTQYGGYTTGGYTTTTHPVNGMQIHQTPPPDHYCLAIFVTLCCFWPTGIMAIMKASDARSAVARGDLNSAYSQARSAKQMINISIGIGIASIALIGIIVGVYLGLVLNSGWY